MSQSVKLLCACCADMNDLKCW